MKRLIRNNERLYIYLGVILLLVLLWRALDGVTQRFSRLPIKEVPRIPSKVPPIDAKSFYPVWVKQARARPAPVPEVDIEALFKAPEEPKSSVAAEMAAPVEPDYTEQFQRSARVDGVSNEGVFVNGQYYKAGEKLELLDIRTLGGKILVPAVESVSQGRVVFRVGGKTSTFVAGPR